MRQLRSLAAVVLVLTLVVALMLVEGPLTRAWVRPTAPAMSAVPKPIRPAGSSSSLVPSLPSDCGSSKRSLIRMINLAVPWATGSFAAA